MASWIEVQTQLDTMKMKYFANHSPANNIHDYKWKDWLLGAWQRTQNTPPDHMIPLSGIKPPPRIPSSYIGKMEQNATNVKSALNMALIKLQDNDEQKELQTQISTTLKILHDILELIKDRKILSIRPDSIFTPGAASHFERSHILSRAAAAEFVTPAATAGVCDVGEDLKHKLAILKRMYTL